MPVKEYDYTNVYMMDNRTGEYTKLSDIPEFTETATFDPDGEAQDTRRLWPMGDDGIEFVVTCNKAELSECLQRLKWALWKLGHILRREHNLRLRQIERAEAMMERRKKP